MGPGSVSIFLPRPLQGVTALPSRKYHAQRGLHLGAPELCSTQAGPGDPNTVHGESFPFSAGVPWTSPAWFPRGSTRSSKAPHRGFPSNRPSERAFREALKANKYLRCSLLSNSLSFVYIGSFKSKCKVLGREGIRRSEVRECGIVSWEGRTFRVLHLYRKLPVEQRWCLGRRDFSPASCCPSSLGWTGRVTCLLQTSKLSSQICPFPSSSKLPENLSGYQLPTE